MTKILFHHIPMTVDAAIVDQAEALFGHRVCPAHDDQALAPGMIEDERYVFYHGNFSQAVVQHFRHTIPDGFLFTFLRHPFTRVLAHYYDLTDHAKIVRELDLIGASPARDGAHRVSCVRFRNKIQHMSLDAFLTSTDRGIRRVASNLQAQCLTVCGGEAAAFRFEQAVVTAMMTYDFVGVRELHAPCLRIIEAKCELPPESLNLPAEQDDEVFEVTADQMEASKAANAYDLALYHAFYAFLLRSYGDYLPPSALDVTSTVRLPFVRPRARPLGVGRLHL